MYPYFDQGDWCVSNGTMDGISMIVFRGVRAVQWITQILLVLFILFQSLQMPAKPTKPEVSVLGPLGTYTHEVWRFLNRMPHIHMAPNKFPRLHSNVTLQFPMCWLSSTSWLWERTTMKLSILISDVFFSCHSETSAYYQAWSGYEKRKLKKSLY